MPAEAVGGPFAVHASAVAIGDRALLIRGASRAGKSRLALALIARATPDRPIHLIGDDRILLQPVADGFVARPHPRIAGFIERRGLGLVAIPWVEQARVGGIVDLELPARHSGAPKANPEPVNSHASAESIGSGCPPHEPGHDAPWDADLPRLAVTCADESERAAQVLRWWAGLAAACAPHLLGKTDDASLADAKD